MNILENLIYKIYKRITPENITELKNNEIFVFGSNTRGMHGGGAAAAAMKWGAVIGNGYGIQGQTYAIPTLYFPASPKRMEILPINMIKHEVDIFIDYAKNNPNKIFLVTKIGTGIANIPFNTMAPLFKNAIKVKNIHLPIEFWDIII